MQESSYPQNHTSLCDGFNILYLLMCDGDFPWMRKNVLHITVMYCGESANVCLWTFVLHVGCHIHYFLRDFCCYLLWLFEYLLKIKQKHLTHTFCSYWHTILLHSYMVYTGCSRLVDVTAGGDFLSLRDQKSLYKHVSDFGRLWSYNRLKLRIEGNDYWQ